MHGHILHEDTSESSGFASVRYVGIVKKKKKKEKSLSLNFCCPILHCFVNYCESFHGKEGGVEENLSLFLARTAETFITHTVDLL